MTHGGGDAPESSAPEFSAAEFSAAESSAADGEFTSSQRYSRQVRFAPFGPDGQRSLASRHALLIGLGALGTHIANWLWRAGIGRLTMVDRDIVDLANLQRQVLFGDDDARAGRPKAVAAVDALSRIGGYGVLDGRVAEFDAELFRSLQNCPDLLIDATDNFATRYLINDLAIEAGRPWIHGAVVGAEGRGMVFRPGLGPCLRCLLPDAPPTGEIGTCETVGVLAPAVAQIAAFQTAEALKLLAGRDQVVARGMLVIDVWHARFDWRFTTARARPDCASCGTRQLPALAPQAAAAVVELCGRDAVQVRPRGDVALDLDRLADRLAGVATDLQPHRGWLRFTTEACRFTVFADGRALLFGVADTGRARALYDRYVGAGN